MRLSHPLLRTLTMPAARPGAGSASPSPRRRRRLAALATVLLSTGTVALIAPAPASAESYARPSSGTFTLHGHGFGHGRGMSQWGAYGAAHLGVPYRTILSTYYPGTTLTTSATSTIRVRLTLDSGQLRAASGGGLALVETSGVTTPLSTAASQWRLAPNGSGSLTLQQLTDTWHAVPVHGSGSVASGARFTASSGLVRLFRANNTSTAYRGTPSAVLSGTSILSVLRLPVDDYLRGVVPRESPASWPADALRSQAVAARTYAVAAAGRNARSSSDLCDSTACQVFSGTTSYTAAGSASSLEYASSDSAVRDTAAQILTYGGAPAVTEYSSSNGGWSTSGGVPYLVAKADPWDGAAPGNPVHSWTTTMRASDLEARYPSIGTLQQIQVTSRDAHGDWGGRVLTAVLVGSRGSQAVSGGSLASGLLSSWFTIQSTLPFGHLDVAAASPGGRLHVTGWAVDPDTTAPIAVHVYVDGRNVSQAPAAASRPDVAAVWPTWGASHGFDLQLPASRGTHSVCAYAINVGSPTVNPSLGCLTATVSDSAPYGHLDAATWTGSRVALAGWAADADSRSPVRVTTTVDGAASVSVSTSVARPDVAAVYPAAGPDAGFTTTLTTARGSHAVCAAATDAGGGPASPLGCVRVVVP